MSEKPDGGAAFPRSDAGYSETQDGMSLRDWFAGQALGGFCVGASRERISDFVNGRLAGDSDAIAAYVLADAMLKERAK